MSATLADRFRAMRSFDPADGLELRLGTPRDYTALSEHHYRAAKPATATRVLVYACASPSVEERYLALAGRSPRPRPGLYSPPLAAGGRGEDVAQMDDQAFSTHEASRHSMDGRRAHDQHQPRPRPGLYSPPLAAGGRGDAAGDARAEGGRVVAVLVESLPALSCRLRDEALGDRYSAWTDARERAAVLNAEVRCISRVVVHPRWRGAGLAVRLVRAALARPTTAVTEAIAAMGAVNPFFEKAGMTPYRRPPHEADARLRAALASVGLGAESLATPDATLARIGAMPARSRAFVLRELSRWHARLHHGTHASAAATEQMAEARARLMCEPVYYVKVNDRDDRAQDDATTKTPRHQEDEDVEKFLGRHLGR